MPRPKRPLLCLVIASILIMFSCSSKKQKHLSNEKIIALFSQNDQLLDEPNKGDWLYDHKEPGQNLTQYKALQPLRPTSQRNKIYLLPLGEHSPAQLDVIQFTADYLQIYFGLSTIVLSPISDNDIREPFRRSREDGHQQLLAPYILDSVLKNKIPEDAVTLMAITEKDLFPKPAWSFVFGLATLKDRVGVSSIYRYSKTPIDTANYYTCLERLIKTSAHEIGHMFTLRHCTIAACIMNGSNSLSESDRAPNRLCTQCLGKLNWNLEFDVLKRAKSLDSFFVHHKLSRDHEMFSRDLQLIN
jgi:archaemetzincin